MDSPFTVSPQLLETLQARQEARFFQDALSLYIPPQVVRYVGDETPKDAVDCISRWLSDNQSSCLLLLGDSGAGKTLFGQWLTRHCAQHPAFAKRVPLFIPLLAVKHPHGNLMSDYLKKHLEIEDKNQRDEILAQPLLLILDGFDEIRERKNLFLSNELWRLNDVKVIISCRSQALAHIQDYASLFCPYDQHNKPQPYQLQEYVVTPFSETEIEAYLKKYVQTRTHRIETIVRETENLPGFLKQNWGMLGNQEITCTLLNHLDKKNLSNAGQVSKGWRYGRLQKQLKDSAKWMRWETYQEYIQKLPGLQRLLSSPFVLSLVVEVLPSIIEQHQDKENITQLELARINLYDHFIEQWFSRQKQKLLDAGHISESCPIEEAFMEYSKTLAHAMLQKNVTSVEYIPKTTTPFLKGQGIFSSPSSESNVNNDDPWAIFFLEKNCPVGNEEIKLSLIRAGCPLMKLGDNQYAFLHKSLLEYFAARKLFEGAMNSASIALGFELNEKLLLDEPATLHFLAERVEQDGKLKECLFGVMEESKYEERVQVASANAITILNYAGVSFSQRDLRHIRIPGADLSNAILDSTDLREADLRHVSFNDAWLNNAKLGGALMEGIQFGECPSLAGRKFLMLTLGADPIQCIAYSPDSIAFSPDGKMLVSGNGDTVCLWNVESRKRISKMRGHTNAVISVAFSPDGKVLASGSEDKTVRLWDVESYKPAAEMKGHTNTVISVAFSPDGKVLASGSKDKTVRLWDTKNQKQITEIKVDTHAKVIGISFSPDGSLIASGSDDNIICLWDAKNQKQITEIKVHTHVKVTGISFSPDGMYLAVSSETTIHLWNVGSRKQMIGKMEGHTGTVKSIAFSPDGKTLASGSYDKTVRLWNLGSRKQIGKIEELKFSADSVTFSPDGKYLVADGWDFILWDVYNQKEVAKIEQYRNVAGVVFSPNGRYLAWISSNTVHLWDVQSQKLVGKMNEHMDKHMGCIAFSPDSRFLVSGSDKNNRDIDNDNNTVFLWDVESQKLVGEIKGHTGYVKSIAFSPDGGTLVSGGYNYTVLGGYDPTVCLWDIRNQKPAGEMRGHEYAIETVAFSPDGNLIASGSKDETVRLWDFNTRKCLNIFKLNFHVNVVIFKKEGEKTYLSVGGGRAIYYFEIKPIQLKPEFVLLGIISRDTGLICDQMDMGGAVVALESKENPIPIGMDASNERLLHQRGAVGKLSQKTTKDVLEARRHRIPYNPNQPPYNLFSGKHFITPGNSVVSLVRKKTGKGSEHVFLVIEAISESNYCDYYTLTRADFFLDQRQEHSKGVIFSSGQALIEICTKPLSEMQLLAQQCVYKCWSISTHQAYILLQNLETDRLKYIAYLNLGNSPLYSAIDLKAEKHNCLTWCEEHLTQIGVDVTEQQSWLDVILAHPDFHLPVNNNELHSEEKCLMM